MFIRDEVRFTVLTTKSAAAFHKIARALLGSVAKLTVLELDDAKDITEWFERGHSEVELIAAIDEVIHAG